jgi:hypothetical protein
MHWYNRIMHVESKQACLILGPIAGRNLAGTVVELIISMRNKQQISSLRAAQATITGLDEAAGGDPR